MTYLDASTGAYLNGTLSSSSFGVGTSPQGVAANPTAGLTYVANAGSGTVTYLDAGTRSYAFPRKFCLQSFNTGSSPSSVAVMPAVE